MGREIVAELGKDPKQWKTVYALSRSKKEEFPNNVTHTFINLQAPAEEMAKELKDVVAEYVFIGAYLQKDDEEENLKANGKLSAEPRTMQEIYHG